MASPPAHGLCARRLRVPVAGGLLAVGGARPGQEGIPPSELFDEATGRWFQLPHAMAEPRYHCSAASLPAAALAPPGAGGGEGGEAPGAAQ